ncbi:MAG: heme ABC exporter ATP-binding protein CcmA [Alphaproteobacteria bacterium]|nr:heme ABC exporter ATP-binding protein CcmA [Alphaproteobacteria bacterium]
MNTLIGKDLACTRGDHTIYEGISLELKSGDTLLLTGHNGSGKTTLLRNISGLIPFSNGALLWNNAPAQDLSHKILFLSQDLPLKPELSLSDNLAFLHAALNITSECGTDDLLGKYGLQDLGDYPVHMLSSGQKRRLLMILLESKSRPLWLLDEPTTHLDRGGIELLLNKLEFHKKNGGLTVIATHQPEIFGDAMMLNMEAHRN